MQVFEQVPDTEILHKWSDKDLHTAVLSYRDLAKVLLQDPDTSGKRILDSDTSGPKRSWHRDLAQVI